VMGIAPTKWSSWPKWVHIWTHTWIPVKRNISFMNYLFLSLKFMRRVTPPKRQIHQDILKWQTLPFDFWEPLHDHTPTSYSVAVDLSAALTVFSVLHSNLYIALFRHKKQSRGNWY
jgi:hypothetical protein